MLCIVCNKPAGQRLAQELAMDSAVFLGTCAGPHPMQKEMGGPSGHPNLPLPMGWGTLILPDSRTIRSLEAQAGFGTSSVYLWNPAGDTSLTVLLVSV